VTAGRIGDVLYVLLRDDAARRIAWRVQDYHARPIIDEAVECF
jgi:hypothetical protein